MAAVIKLCDDGIPFIKQPYMFDKVLFTNVFAKKNNKTLGETLDHKRYRKLADIVSKYYLKYIEWPLGFFLSSRKKNHDQFYKEFLNPYGDMTYSRFQFSDEHILSEKGVYAFRVREKIKYIGQTKTTFNQRIKFGYGRIQPKNCYIDGQRTNCKINAHLTGFLGEFEIFLHPMSEDSEIESLENQLIQKYLPAWNVKT